MFLSRMDIWLLEAVNQIQDTLLNCIRCFLYRRIKEICNKDRPTWIRTCSSRSLRCVILLPWCLNSSGLDCGKPCCIDALFTFQFLIMYVYFLPFLYICLSVYPYIKCGDVAMFCLNYFLLHVQFHFHLRHLSHVASLKKKNDDGL